MSRLSLNYILAYFSIAGAYLVTLSFEVVTKSPTLLATYD